MKRPVDRSGIRALGELLGGVALVLAALYLWGVGPWM